MVYTPVNKKRLRNYIDERRLASTKQNIIRQLQPSVIHKVIRRQKSSSFNNYSDFVKYINVGSDLSLTHIYNIRKYDVEELLINNNDNIDIDFLFIYAKLLELDTSDIFNIDYKNSNKSSSKSSSNSRKPKRQRTQGGAISFNYNNILKGFLENQFIFDNKHDFGNLITNKDYLYSKENITNEEPAILNILKSLFEKDERSIFFNLIQQNIIITQNILYINLNEIEKKQASDIITNTASITTDATTASQNIVNYLQQVLNISDVKYITDGKLNIKNDKKDASKSSILYNNIVSNVNKYLNDNKIYTLENCYDSLSIKIGEAYAFFNSPNFVDSIEIFAYISALVFDHSINNLPSTVPISIFKAFNKKTSDLFNVVYYKYKQNPTDTTYKYQTALVFKKTSKITELLTAIGKNSLDFNLIILKKNLNQYVYEKTDNLDSANPALFYAFDLHDIKNFNSVKNITKCINETLKDINDRTISVFMQNYKRLLATPNNINNNITFILLYIYNYFSSKTGLTTIQINKKIAYILFDLKKAGDMCKILATFYYSYIINNNQDPTNLTAITTSHPNSIPAITQIIKSTVAFSSNDKLAALNSLFKESNNVFFGDGKTKTLYIYNNDNNNFNMNIVYLWLNKYLCVNNFNLNYDVIEELNKNINNPDFQTIFTDIDSAISIRTTKSITEKINIKLYPLYTTQTLANFDLKQGLSKQDKNEYNIYIRVLVLAYINKIQAIISENLTNVDNNMIFAKNMFDSEIYNKQPNYKNAMDKIITKLFIEINNIVIQIINDIKTTIINNLSINFIKSEHLYLTLTIINNIFMIINTFLFCNNNKIQIINEINNIKQNINDLFAKKYSYDCITTEARKIQQIKSSLSYCIINKIESYRIKNEEKEQKSKSKSKSKSKKPADTITINTSEITSYINNFITKIDIINYIMIFNKYYDYFDKIIEYNNTNKVNNKFNINPDSIKLLIDKIKVIYYYIYIQTYVKNKDIIPSILPTTTIKDFHKKILSSIIDDITKKVITTIINTPVVVKGILGESPTEKAEREEREKEKMEEMQKVIIDGIKSKIDILKENIETLKIFNYKKKYDMDSLFKITLLPKDLDDLDDLNDLYIDTFHRTVDANIRNEAPNNKLVSIYYFLMFNINPQKDKKYDDDFDVILD